MLVLTCESSVKGSDVMETGFTGSVPVMWGARMGQKHPLVLLGLPLDTLRKSGDRA